MHLSRAFNYDERPQSTMVPASLAVAPTAPTTTTSPVTSTMAPASTAGVLTQACNFFIGANVDDGL